jgi:hypothetical protein
VRRARDRPPKLEPRVGASQPAAELTLAALIERAKLAGPGATGPGPTELRRTVERLVAGDRHGLGALAPLSGLTRVEAWAAITQTFGATAVVPVIDPACTEAGARAAVGRVRDVAEAGGRVALATAFPASMLPMHLAFARLAQSQGGEVVDLDDYGPIRADGRTPRWLRWIGGVAVVSDGRALFDTADAEAAREWMFVNPRPALVVADGPFAEVASEAGVEVVAFAGLERPGLAIAGARSGRCTIVPVRTDRSARDYAMLERLLGAAPGGRGGEGPTDDRLPARPDR